MDSNKSKEFDSKSAYLKSENDDTSNSDTQVILKELTQKQLELEDKNRELFIVKRELEYYNAKYEKIYENSPNGYFTFDNFGAILKLNATGAEQLGGTKEFLVNKLFQNFVATEHLSSFKVHLESLFTYNKRQTCEVKIQRKDKSLFYALVEIVPSNGYGGYGSTCECAVSDITRLKVAEDEIKESEARFQNMANTAPVLIWISDADALFNFVNNFWLKYTGRTLGQELGMGWIEGIHHEDLDRFMQIYKSSFDARQPFEIEFRLKKHDGNYRWIISKGVPRFQSDGRFAGYIGSCTDINDQKVIEGTVKKFNEELKILNSSKDKFFSIIAHDLKSPLSGLLGFTEILVEEFDDLDDEEKREFIGHSHQASKNLMALLENLLEWSRIQIGNNAFEPEEVALEPIIEEIFSLFNQNAKSKNIQLVKNIDSEVNVVADQNMIKTILRNLISNGIKFTNDGGTVSISAEEQNEFIKISVSDSGVGISKENINKLFKIDGGFTTPGTTNERGTGLGLVLCKELVEKNGGKISVESEPGRGTKFIFTLPKQ